MDPFSLVGLIAFMGGLTGIVTIISRAVMRMQERSLQARKGGLEPSVQAELEELRAQLAEQEDLRQRLLELEERVDFTERMLAQAKHDRLPAGGSRDDGRA